MSHMMLPPTFYNRTYRTPDLAGIPFSCKAVALAPTTSIDSIRIPRTFWQRRETDNPLDRTLVFCPCQCSFCPTLPCVFTPLSTGFVLQGPLIFVFPADPSV